ncbi:YdcF family protein [Microbacterium sp. RD1]|uniref:YdcF family protein n=1 Tax=Microbacterium sp. RD1 TaxID=3457313 RepID=UPI003FA60542
MPFIPSRRRALRRTLLIGASALVGLTLTWFIGALILFVFPRQQPLQKADAIVSLSPPRERLPVALQAVEDGLAPQLWVSNVPADITRQDQSLMTALCREGEYGDAKVSCFAPLTEDTIGEAGAVADLIQETGAKSVIVVTNVSHSTRVRYLFERCLPAGTRVQLLLVDEPNSPSFRLRRVLYESGAFVKAAIESRRCE